MKESAILQKHCYDYYSMHGAHQFVNALGNAYFKEGVVDTLEEGFQQAEAYLENELETN